jgi:hypothetical protein
MSYSRFAEIAVAPCFGLIFALVGWWEVAGPIWRAEWIGSAEQWLNVASATLVGCAILVGGVGALFGAHWIEVICDDCQPSVRLSRASTEDASRWRDDPLSVSRYVEGVPDDAGVRHGRDRTRRFPTRGLKHTADNKSLSDRVC